MFSKERFIFSLNPFLKSHTHFIIPIKRQIWREKFARREFKCKCKIWTPSWKMVTKVYWDKSTLREIGAESLIFILRDEKKGRVEGKRKGTMVGGINLEVSWRFFFLLVLGENTNRINCVLARGFDHRKNASCYRLLSFYFVLLHWDDGNLFFFLFFFTFLLVTFMSKLSWQTIQWQYWKPHKHAMTKQGWYWERENWRNDSL